jgi:hypothetical protein
MSKFRPERHVGVNRLANIDIKKAPKCEHDFVFDSFRSFENGMGEIHYCTRCGVLKDTGMEEDG